MSRAAWAPINSRPNAANSGGHNDLPTANHIFDFLWASTLSRGLRFFLLAFLIHFFKDTAINIIKNYFSTTVIIITTIFIFIIIGLKVL